MKLQWQAIPSSDKKVLAKFHTIKHLFLHHRVLAKCLNPQPLRPPGFAISKMNCNILPIPESFSSQIKVLLLHPKNPAQNSKPINPKPTTHKPNSHKP